MILGSIISFIIWIVIQSGYYLAVDLPGWSEGLHTVGTWILLFITLFSAEFLELKVHLPKVRKIFDVFAATFFLLGIFTT